MNSVSIAKIRRVWTAASVLQEEGRPYGLRELQIATGLSKPMVWHCLDLLHDAGYVYWEPGAHRTLRVLIPCLPLSPQNVAVLARWEEQHAREEVVT